MPEFTYTLDLPPGIFSDDTAFSTKGRWIEGNNVRFWNGKPQIIGGSNPLWDGDSVTPINNPANGNYRNVFAWNRAAASGGVAVAFGATGSNAKLIVSHNVTALAGAADRTPASHPLTPSPSVKYWCFGAWGETLLAIANGYTLYEQSGTSQATDVTNAPDVNTFMLVTPSRQVMMLGTNEEISTTFNPMCIRWCDIEDYTDWTTTSTNNAGEHILPGSGSIVAGTVIADYILIWTTDALWAARFTGDPAATFDFELIDEKCGLIYADAFTILGQTAFWLDPTRRFRSYQVGGIVQTVPCTVWNDFFTQMTDSTTITMGTVSKFGEVWLFYTDGVNGVRRYLAFSTLDGSWFTGIKNRIGWLDSHALTTNSTFRDTYDSTVIGIVGDDHTVNVEENGTAAANFTWSLKSGGQYVDEGKRRVLVRDFVPDFEDWAGTYSNVRVQLHMRQYPHSDEVTKGPYDLAIPASGWLVNGAPADGATSVNIDTGTGGFIAGDVVTFAGVNGWVGGADSGKLARFNVTANEQPEATMTLGISPALIESGASRNIVALPANNAAVTLVSNPHRKCFRASGRIMSVEFGQDLDTGPQANISLRFGKPTFDCVTLGER